MVDAPDITPLLARAHEGDQEALEEVARLLYADLVRVARRLMRGGGAGDGITLEPAALVNETFIRLIQQRNRYRNRQHFFAIATRIMLRVLGDYHRKRKRLKRAGGRLRVSLSALGQEAAVPPDTEIPVLIEAVERLEQLDRRASQVAKLRVLWDLEPDEIADVLGVSRSTVDRDWRFARAWLASNLKP